MITYTAHRLGVARACRSGIVGKKEIGAWSKNTPPVIKQGGEGINELLWNGHTTNRNATKSDIQKYSEQGFRNGEKRNGGKPGQESENENESQVRRKEV